MVPNQDRVDRPPATAAAQRLAALAGADWLTPFVLASLSAVLYLVTVSERVTLDSFLPLADGFLDGRLYIDQPMPWLELVPRPEGGSYTPFPPMPAVVLVPFVALFGPGFDQGVATALFGGANVALVWLLLRGVSAAPQPAGWLTAAFAVGSVHWWAAGTGTVWLHAHVVAVFFALLALNLAIRHRWPLVAGLVIGCAAASRLPIGLTLPLYLALFMNLRFPPWLRRPSASEIGAGALVVIGLAIPAIGVAGYNVARFGSPFEFGTRSSPAFWTSRGMQRASSRSSTSRATCT